jgi:ABC-type transporter Mla subunit MlaD
MIKRPYLTVLSFAIAVIAAFWLGFSAFYINALKHHPATVAAVRPAHAAGLPAGAPGAAPTPVTTRVS